MPSTESPYASSASRPSAPRRRLCRRRFRAPRAAARRGRVSGDRNREDVDLRCAADRLLGPAVQLPPQPGMAGSRAPLGGPAAGLHGVVRVAGRPRDDQPPLRPWLHRFFHQAGRGPAAGRLLRQAPRRGAPVPRDVLRPTARHHRRHRQRERGGARGHGGGQGGDAAGCGHQRARVALRRWRGGHFLPGGHHVPWRPVQAVPVPPLHRPAAGLRGREPDRLLRRRSRQLHLSALRPGHVHRARVRERTAGAHRVLPVEPQRLQRPRTGVRGGQPRLDRAPEHVGAAPVPA